MPSIIIKGLGGPLLISQGLGSDSSPIGEFRLTSISSSIDLLTLSFTEALSLSGPAADFSSYFITGEILYPEPLITSLTVVGGTLLLGITEQHDGGSYTLNIPVSGFNSVFGDPYLSSYTPGFTGVGVSPALLMSRQIDARTIEVIFSERINVLSGQNSQNYSISGGVKVFSAVQVSPIIYRLTTSRIDVNTSDTYTLTVSNIVDEEGNPIG